MNRMMKSRIPAMVTIPHNPRIQANLPIRHGQLPGQRIAVDAIWRGHIQIVREDFPALLASGYSGCLRQ
jgi:hypothetical protein